MLNEIDDNYTDFNWLTIYQNDKVLERTKLKASADDILYVAKKTISVLDRIENIVGKRRKCWLPAFSPFPTMFSKIFSFNVDKTRDLIVKG